MLIRFFILSVKCKPIVENSVTKSTLCITVFAETFDMKLGISKRLNVLQQNEWMAPPSSYGLPTFCMTNYVITWYWLITYFYMCIFYEILNAHISRSKGRKSWIENNSNLSPKFVNLLRLFMDLLNILWIIRIRYFSFWISFV